MTVITRRRFLKISAVTFGAATAATQLPRVAAVNAADTAANGAAGTVTTIPTYCEMCFWRCGGIGHVRDGKLWKFEGNPLDPACRGRLCPRGTGAVGSHYDPDRLRAPLIRSGERGKEQWKVATWDEAFTYIAERMNKIKAQHGPESVALFNHGVGAKFIRHALQSWGVNNVAEPSFAQCRGPRDVGFTLTYGASVGSPESTDIANTNCLVLIGSHLGENMHNTQVQEFTRAVERGIPIIVVDPRQSTAASKAKYWLPIRPGTDIALLLAWMNVLVNENRYDRAFVDKYGTGFEQFVEAIKPYTPQWAESETDIKAEVIRATALEMAQARPATLVHPGRRTVWNGDDTQRSRAIALLNALLGSWGAKGGIYLPVSAKAGGFPLPPPPESTKPKADNNGRWPFADDAVTVGLRDATITGKPYPIKGWFVYSTNLINALPNQQETLKAIATLDLLVVIDTMPSEIASYADVVLPESMFLERHDDLQMPASRRGWIALRQPVVPSPHEQKPNWWIAKHLADKLGVGASLPFKDLEEYLRTRIEKGGYDWEKFKREGIILGEEKPIYAADGATMEFDTPSGKIEFYSKQLKDKGFDPVPKYTRRPGPPADGYFRMVTGRAPMHTFSRTQTNPLLASVMPENEVWVHADTVQKLGLVNNQYVRLKNQDGVVCNQLRVKATQRIRPDTVYMVYGFGHTSAQLKSAYLKGASAAQLLTRYEQDPLMGGTSIHSNFVSFVKEA